MLNIKVVTWSLAIWTTFSFLFCVAFAMLTPQSLNMHRSDEARSCHCRRARLHDARPARMVFVVAAAIQAAARPTEPSVAMR